MTGKFKKALVMPIILNLKRNVLSLPETIALAERQQMFEGVLTWRTPEWDQAEYAKVQQKVETIMPTSMGVELEDFMMKLAEGIRETIPDRRFEIIMGSFSLEYEPEEKKGE